MIDISRDLVHLPPFIKDDVTGLTWWFTYRQGSFEEMKDECAVSYGGIEDWRLPTPQELATLSDLGMLYGSKIDPVYFAGLYSDTSLPQSKSYGYDLILTSVENYFYLLQYGVIMRTSSGGLDEPTRSSSPDGYLMCVSGEKYGEVSAETYSTVTENGKEMILDSSTNLFWQKESVKKATWKEALKYCEDSTYAGHSDWRLPNKNELLSLVDYSKLEEAEEEPFDEPELRDVTEEEDEVGAISSFPGMTPDLFWTSTPAPVDYLVDVLEMAFRERIAGETPEIRHGRVVVDDHVHVARIRGDRSDEAPALLGVLVVELDVACRRLAGDSGGVAGRDGDAARGDMVDAFGKLGDGLREGFGLESLPVDRGHDARADDRQDDEAEEKKDRREE